MNLSYLRFTIYLLRIVCICFLLIQSTIVRIKFD